MAADILVVDGDPTQDIEKAAVKDHHRMVMKAGKVVKERAH